MKMMRQAWIASALLQLLGSAAALTQESVVDALHSTNLCKGTEIFLRNDPNWETDTIQRFTTYKAPKFVAAVKPACAEDVQKIVSVANAHNIPFLASGGGHGFSTTFGRLQQGLLLDLGHFKDVKVNKKASTLTIGASVVFKDIFDPVFKAGKEVVTGTYGCVGMIGATLGGGLGRYNGLHGMILDSLLSVDMIVANGTRLTASKTKNADLFWGMRGAGMNFGVILSATYQLYDLTSRNVMNWDLVFTLNQTRHITEWLKGMEDDQDVKLAPILLAGYDEARYGGTYFNLNVVYAGPKEKGKPMLDSLLKKTGPPLLSNLTEPTWARMPYDAFNGILESGPDTRCNKLQNDNVYAGTIDSYDVDSMDTFYRNYDKFLRETPDARHSVYYLEHFAKQGPLSVPLNETSYPWRDTTAHYLINVNYNDRSLATKVDKFGRRQRALIQKGSGFADGPHLYVSYGHGDEGAEWWYSKANLPRLGKLKSEWDPNNIFRFNNPVPLPA